MSDAVIEVDWAKGQDGRTIWTVATMPPPSNVGNYGDFALVVQGGVHKAIYGPKTGAGWGNATIIPGKNYIFKTATLNNANDGVDGDSGMTFISGVMTFYGPKTAGAWGTPIGTVAPLKVGSNLSDVQSKVTSRNNLGVAEKLGTPIFTIGSESSNAITVAIQLRDSTSNADIESRYSIFAYLSDDANGDSVAGTAPSGGVAIGTDGLAIPIVAGKAFQLVSEADGDIDLVITESGADTWYLVLVMPDGRLVVSNAITFVA